VCLFNPSTKPATSSLASTSLLKPGHKVLEYNYLDFANGHMWWLLLWSFEQVSLFASVVISILPFTLTWPYLICLQWWTFTKHQANLKVGPIIGKLMAKVNHGSQWTSWAHRATTTVRWCSGSATTYPVSYWFIRSTSGSHVLWYCGHGAAAVLMCWPSSLVIIGSLCLYF
jgi:hypothetical protein